MDAPRIDVKRWIWPTFVTSMLPATSVPVPRGVTFVAVVELSATPPMTASVRFFDPPVLDHLQRQSS